MYIIVAVLWATGSWDFVYELVVEGEYSGKIFVNILLLGIIGGAIAIVLATSGKKGE